jgi:hypothetical protein
MATSTRRAMLHAAGLAGAALPFGLVGPRGLATSRLAFDPIAAPPICHAAAQVPPTVVQGPRKNLRLTWDASAICTVGVPVAQTKGYFEKRNLAVELITSVARPTSCWRQSPPAKRMPALAWRCAGSSRRRSVCQTKGRPASRHCSAVF